MKIAKIIMALGVAAFLLFFGVSKFTGAHIFPYIEFRASGLGLPFAEYFYPYVNWATGLLEIGAGALLILPATRRSGAILAVAPFLGAFAFHLSPLLGINTPNGFSENLTAGSLADLLASGGPFARADFSADQSTTLFMLATVFLVLAVINALLQRN